LADVRLFGLALHKGVLCLLRLAVLPHGAEMIRPGATPPVEVVDVGRADWMDGHRCGRFLGAELLTLDVVRQPDMGIAMHGDEQTTPPTTAAVKHIFLQ